MPRFQRVPAAMSLVSPSLSPSIATIAPGFRALSIHVSARPVRAPDIAVEATERALAALKAGAPWWADAHLDAWARVFRNFGAKPQRTPCSADALRKRAQRDGALPQIDPIVDLYNAISMQFAVPVGGENLDAYQGSPRLVIADGNETFDSMKNGEPTFESPDEGEVVWRDDLGVTCRRWNWRQGVRTRLDQHAARMWFILESLPEMPIEALHEAGDTLERDILRMMPGSLLQSEMLRT